MIALDISTLPALLMTISAYTCPAPPPPTVTVDLNYKEPDIITTQTIEQLSQIPADTQIPKKEGELWLTGGLTAGNIKMSYHTDFQMLTYQQAGRACIWLSNVKVTFDHTPTVYIASDYAGSQCRYNTTLKHELQHVYIDQRALSDFLPIFETTIRNALARVQKPSLMDSQKIMPEKERLHHIVTKVVDGVWEDFGTHRLERQQRIDTREEYDRLKRLCKD